MDRYICIHGHFYQPPRENPWLEAIEPQESAHPFENWNERVSAECYEPNLHARILDEQGRIRRMVNNYARISFNFGPTLMLWLERYAPEVYAGILEADRMSAERFGGHGSALAMPFNHMIMPLANERDRITQVRWGIRDFERRFKRRPEGMWLPETAVDRATLRVMAEEGIRFTILAPAQAARVRRTHLPSWRDVSGGRIETGEAYRVSLEGKNEISVFFYDGPVANAVAFEHLLQKGEALVDRLVGAFPSRAAGPCLVSIATDGESYGHHHRFGEMALAYALDRIEHNDQIRLTNYAEFLDVRPAVAQVELVENSSWSCAHGIERWRSDCGCHTNRFPHGNQAWRAPLRTAMDALRDAVAPEYERLMSRLVLDPWDARNAYVEVVLDRTDATIDRFLQDYSRTGLTMEDQSRALAALEMQRHLMYMYTSCGWFFDDISGIESVQCLQYAARALQLAEKLFDIGYEKPFLAILLEARSNDPEMGHGENVYTERVLPASVDFHRLGAHFIVWSLFDRETSHRTVYAYDLELCDYRLWEDGPTRLVLARGEVSSRMTRERASVAMGAVYFGGHNLNAAVHDDPGHEAMNRMLGAADAHFKKGDYVALIRLLDEELGCCTFSLLSLFKSERQKVIGFILGETLAAAERSYRETYERNAPLMRFLAELDLAPPPAFSLAAEYVLHADLETAFGMDDLDPARITYLLNECREEKIQIRSNGLAKNLERGLYRLAVRVRDDIANRENLDRLRSGVGIISRVPFMLNLSRTQKVVFGLMDRDFARQREQAEAGDAAAQDWIQTFREIARDLSIRLDE